MPCWELFDRQPKEYRDEVLPPSVKARVAIEQASTLGWDRYVGDGGAVIGMHTFGASAPLKHLLDEVRLHARPCGAGRARASRSRKGQRMKATELLHEHGQSLWLDNITRSMLDNGVDPALHRPLLGDRAHLEPVDLRQGDRVGRLRRRDPREGQRRGSRARSLFFELAIEDLHRAADLFLPIHERTRRRRRLVSLEVSPELAYDTETTVAAAKDLHARAGAAQPVHQDPRHRRGPAGDQECIAAGVPVNVTLLFDGRTTEPPRTHT